MADGPGLRGIRAAGWGRPAAALERPGALLRGRRPRPCAASGSRAPAAGRRKARSGWEWLALIDAALAADTAGAGLFAVDEALGRLEAEDLRAPRPLELRRVVYAELPKPAAAEWAHDRLRTDLARHLSPR